MAFDPRLSINIFDDSGAFSGAAKTGADNYIYLTKLRLWEWL